MRTDELRPILHGKIDTLDARGLDLVHRVLMQLEAERLAEGLRGEFAKEEDLVARVDRAVSEFRKAQPYR